MFIQVLLPSTKPVIAPQTNLRTDHLEKMVAELLYFNKQDAAQVQQLI